jgi:hypothetical protein
LGDDSGAGNEKAITYEAGAGEKTSELSARKSLMNCPCREANAK